MSMQKHKQSQVTGVSKLYSPGAASFGQLQDILWTTFGDDLKSDTLSSASAQFARKAKDWKYDVLVEFPEIDLNTSKLRDKRPEEANFCQVTLRIKADGNGASEDNTAYDPFLHLTVSIIVNARSDKSAVKGEFKCAWHLDSHPPKDATKHDPEKDNFMHPRYHWQYGGSEITGNADMTFGNHLLVTSPRLNHMPLDIVLAIDFVISNYYSKTWKELKKNPQYINLVQESRRRFWKPYITWIVENWPSPESSLASYSFPFLV